MKEYNDLKYTCLFGGGAIRGAAHVGVLKALKDLEIIPQTLGGSSVGSIVAALFAVGYTYQELSEVFLSVNFELFRDISFGFNQKFALSKGKVFLEWIRELIEKKFYGENYKKGDNKPVTFKDIGKNLVIITTDMNRFTCCEFSNFETPDFEIAMAVRISCCMPGLMRAVNFDDCLLVDGDLMKGKPMWYLSKNLKESSDRILEIRLEGTFSGSDESPVEYVNGMYTCMTYSETSFIKDIYGQNDKYDYLVIDTGNVVVVDFNYPTEKRQAIIDDGYRQTVDYFKTSLLNKKQTIFNIYTEILDKIRKIQGFILIKKFNQAKNTIAELFIYLSDVKNIIDEDVYNSISELQKLLYSNIKFGLLGYVSCNNKDIIKTKLSEIIYDLASRTGEMEKYIKKFSI
ncbi:patatin-like phospholipase family protein [bacterium]|nr:patatin-like phospholipase family protein [bacterium]